MNIICHRGLWSKKDQQNSLQACINGLVQYEGIEIDLKNLNGDIVLSHDPLKKGQAVAKLEDLFKKNSFSFYALNIKEDGLGHKLAALLKKYRIKNYMCFDLSRPEWVKYKNLKIKCFDRFGDMDSFPTEVNHGLVVDVFNQRNENRILKQLTKLDSSIPLFIISPELHGHSVEKFWSKIKKMKDHFDFIYLCTDYPQKASHFFK